MVVERSPVVLCVLDGIHEGEGATARSSLEEKFGKTILRVSAEASTGPLVYEAIGTGRAPRPVKARIDRSIEEKKFGANAVVSRAMWIANDRKCRLHLFMPIGEASAHASMMHLSAILRVAEAHEARVVVHAFLEESASAPKSAGQRLEALAFQLEGIGTIGTISGASFALDRGRDRWEKAKPVFSAIVRGEASHKETIFEALEAAYEAGQTDATAYPVRIGDYDGMKGDFMADFTSGKPAWAWFGEEVGLFMTHRPDRIHALAAMMARMAVPPDVLSFLTERGRAIHAFDEFGMLTLTEIDPAFEGVLAAFPSEVVKGTLAEALASAGLSEIRVASDDRAAHVTQFFEASTGASREGERVSIVAGDAVVDEAERVIAAGKHDVVVVSLSGAGEALGRVAKATLARGGSLFVVGAGARGAAELPFVFADGRYEGPTLEPEGSLADVAPTVLDVLGLDKPEGMTGRSLCRARRA